jgi:hypothetical protein
LDVPQGLHGLQAAAQGLHGLQAAAQGLQGLQAAAQGLHGLQAAAQGLHGLQGLQAANCTAPGAWFAAAAGRALALANATAVLRMMAVSFKVLRVFVDMLGSPITFSG